jgi:hypothetical protein
LNSADTRRGSGTINEDAKSYYPDHVAITRARITFGESYEPTNLAVSLGSAEPVTDFTSGFANRIKFGSRSLGLCCSFRRLPLPCTADRNARDVIFATRDCDSPSYCVAQRSKRVSSWRVVIGTGYLFMRGPRCLDNYTASYFFASFRVETNENVENARRVALRTTPQKEPFNCHRQLTFLLHSGSSLASLCRSNLTTYRQA